MKNLEQIRAKNAFKHKDKDFSGSEGGDIVKKIPTLIRDCGILSTLAFALEKKRNGYKNPGHKEVFDCIVEHLKDSEVKKITDDIVSPEKLMEYFTEKVSSSELRAITIEVITYLGYLRRFAKKKEKNEEGD